jgi:hypothetical protein
MPLWQTACKTEGTPNHVVVRPAALIVNSHPCWQRPSCSTRRSRRVFGVTRSLRARLVRRGLHAHPVRSPSPPPSPAVRCLFSAAAAPPGESAVSPAADSIRTCRLRLALRAWSWHSFCLADAPVGGGAVARKWVSRGRAAAAGRAALLRRRPGRVDVWLALRADAFGRRAARRAQLTRRRGRIHGGWPTCAG